MGIFVEGMPCPLCRLPMNDNHALFGTWGVWLPESDPRFTLCDAVIHWNCYAQWEHQPSFARSYFEFWVNDRLENPYWFPAYLDDSAMVTVNPAIDSAWVYVAATGARYNPHISLWQQWLARDDSGCHPLEYSTLAAVKRKLRAEIPTTSALRARVHR